MAAIRGRRRRARQHVAADLDIMPMLNVFISIIPLLLMSAAFVDVSVIQATLPAGATAAAAGDASEEPLELAIVIRADAYLVEGNRVPTRVIPRPAGDAEGGQARAQLEDVLAEIVAAHPGNREVRIVSRATTRYEEIIAVMDVSRAAGLPEAALSRGGDW
jgi:biopolymer transport protein ExbD